MLLHMANNVAKGLVLCDVVFFMFLVNNPTPSGHESYPIKLYLKVIQVY